jgi:predicted DNA-binding protein (MmcQ/YjbR family)
MLPKLRKICLAFPEAEEVLFGGHTTPTFRVRNKIFAMYAEEERGGHAVWCKAPPGAQGVLVGAAPDRFFAPPYVGPKGWIGVRLSGDVDWPQLTDLIADSYRMTAPKRLVAAMST